MMTRRVRRRMNVEQGKEVPRLPHHDHLQRQRMSQSESQRMSQQVSQKLSHPRMFLFHYLVVSACSQTLQQHCQHHAALPHL